MSTLINMPHGTFAFHVQWVFFEIRIFITKKNRDQVQASLAGVCFILSEKGIKVIKLKVPMERRESTLLETRQDQLLRWHGSMKEESTSFRAW